MRPLADVVWWVLVLVGTTCGNVLDPIAIDRLVRKPMQRNLASQLTPPEGYPGRRGLDFSAFERPLAGLGEARLQTLDALLADADVPQLQRLMGEGALSSEELTLYYVSRIRRLDGDLHSVTELNPDALSLARALDAERAAGRVRGPQHGLSVLLKDNIATADAMHTTAGAKALESARAGRDAGVVCNLRDAGALILGKTALSEFANYISPTLPNGFSAVGGQVANPYGPFDVSGSSSSSAVAAAMGFATGTVGTETWGSLIAPASQNSVVAIKPSAGLVPVDGIIPILETWDAAGPMTRHAVDSAILLEAMAGHDGPALALGSESIDTGARSDLRIGIVRLHTEASEGDDELLQRAIETLQRAGAHVVEREPIALIDVAVERRDFFALANRDFARGLDRYLAETSAPVKSLADIIAFNAHDPPARIPFGQDFLIGARDSTLSDAEFDALLQANRVRTRAAVDGLLAGVDVLAGIGSPFFVQYCAAGYPAMTVPAGYRASGEPAGLTFIASRGREARLVRAAGAFERHAAARRPPER